MGAFQQYSRAVNRIFMVCLTLTWVAAEQVGITDAMLGCCRHHGAGKWGTSPLLLLAAWLNRCLSSSAWDEQLEMWMPCTLPVVAVLMWCQPRQTALYICTISQHTMTVYLSISSTTICSNISHCVNTLCVYPRETVGPPNPSQMMTWLSPSP